MDFIAELQKLQLETPRIGQIRLKNVNSEYTAQSDQCKNCYMLANAITNEDCMYGRDFYGDTDCTDCDHIRDCTLCYECLNCERCYSCDYLQDSENSTDCRHCYDLKGCRNCLGCAGLRNKEYHIFNKPYMPEEYKWKVSKLTGGEIAEGFLSAQLSSPRVYSVQVNSENFSGNYVYHCQNAHECFDVVECQDVGYLVECKKLKDSYDVTILEDSELCYNISSSHIIHNCNCCYFCVTSSDCDHSELLFDCKHCFGCISLHHKSYHILNKPYSKEEYFEKAAEIKAQLGALYGEMLIPPTYDSSDTVIVWPVM